MSNNIYTQIHKKFIISGVGLVAILFIGTIGYWFIGGRQYSLLDCLYMTTITISTIGYREVIDLSNNPAGRVFTIFIALSGIGILFYIITNFTAFVVEGELKDTFWRKKMEKMAKNFNDHFIVCGIGNVGMHIVNELFATKRPYVLVDIDKNSIDKLSEELRNQAFIETDVTHDSGLLKAGIKKAKGLFAVTGDDVHNLVICLTAKQLNPDVKVIARCNEIENIEKMKKAGADSVISPSFIGGLRMVSEMIRPSVVSFLDLMLRDKEKNLRIEEISVPDSFVGKPISALNLKKYHYLLLLALKTKDDLIYNPSRDYILHSGDILIFMTTPEERQELKEIFYS